MTNPSPRKQSSVRHTRAIKKALEKKGADPPPAAAVEEHLRELIVSTLGAQQTLCRRLGLRSRILNLLVFSAIIIALVWRRIGSVCELTRMLNKTGVLWSGVVRVSQQAVSKRLMTFPAEVFHKVLEDIIPGMLKRFRERSRPLAPEFAHALKHFKGVVICDGCTMDCLMKKLDMLHDVPGTPLGGRMMVMLDAVSRLPLKLAYEADSAAHDLRFEAIIKPWLQAGQLALFDSAFLKFELLDALTDKGVSFIVRAKSNTVAWAGKVFRSGDTVRDRIVQLGHTPREGTQNVMRLIEIRWKGVWYRYLTNVLDPAVLDAEHILALYKRRWDIESAFLTVKRLLGLAYLWTGSSNGIQLQIWATWLMHAALMDLCDELADKLAVRVERISTEMVFRSLSYFMDAYLRGEASNLVDYLAKSANILGILKRDTSPNRPKKRRPSAVDNLRLGLSCE